MTRSTFFWLSALVCTTAALGVHAQNVETPSAPTVAPGPSTTAGPPTADDDAAVFRRLDRNNDGRVTKAEAQADPEVARRFAELDTDNSGKLEQAEFARFEVKGEAAGSPPPR
jgi:hypothetical protein